jgi:hypothetical protein
MLTSHLWMCFQNLDLAIIIMVQKLNFFIEMLDELSFH